MFSRKKCCLVGHWLSANLGDKYQCLAIFEMLRDTFSFDFVNFISDNGKPMYFDGNIGRQILAPEDVEWENVDLAVVTTGSMDSFCCYVGWIDKIAKKYTHINFVIWGGFSRGYLPIDQWASGLSFLKYPNVEFYARTQMDLDLYFTAFQQDRGYLSGDPIVLWSFLSRSPPPHRPSDEDDLACRQLPPGEAKGKLVVVISVYCFEYDRGPKWEKICEKADLLICIDPYADSCLKNKYPNLAITNKPWEFMNLISGSSHVITGRLHAGVLSFCMGIPTTLVGIDDPEDASGSLKFEAFGNMGVCKYRKLKDIDPENLNRLNEIDGSFETDTCRRDFDDFVKTFKKITLETLERLKSKSGNE